MGEFKEKTVLYFPQVCMENTVQWNTVQHSGRQILYSTMVGKYCTAQWSANIVQHSGQSRSVIKGEATIDRINNTSVNNSNVVLDVS